MPEADVQIFRYYTPVTRTGYSDDGLRNKTISFYNNALNSNGEELKLDTGVPAEDCEVNLTDGLTMFVKEGADISGVTVLGFACPQCPYNPGNASQIRPENKCKAVYVKKPNHKIIG